jgi:hypothetical protein
VKLGEPQDLRLAPRYYQFNRAFAIRDVYDALVELVTNSDDSYHRLFRKRAVPEDGGPILIEYLEQRKGQPSFIIVHDRAEGMALQEMRDKLGNVGPKQSEEGDRGFMARGAKDCTELGPMVVESIKDDAYYKCELTPDAKFVPWESGKRATTEVRDRLHIPRGNGTVVKLQIDARHRMPRYESLLRDLPWHFALRDILCEESKTRALLRNLNRREDRAERVAYRHPEGEVVCDETFGIEAYQGANAHIKIWKSAEAFEDSGDRFRRSGILIKGARAIHECSLLTPEFEKDPYARKYFGRLECAYIDELLKQYDERREKGQPHPDSNPTLLIDPNRQHGLIRDHPFTRALLLVPSERLRALVAKDREADRSKQQQIANQETQGRLDRLARKASEFLRRQLEEIQEVTAGEDVDKSAFAEQGVLIFPTYLNVALGQERTLTYYARASLLRNANPSVTVVADDPALTVLDASFALRPHRSKQDLRVGTFRVRGESLKDCVIIRAVCEGLPPAQAAASVVETKIEEHTFDQPLEFEYGQYRVREGSQKSLELFAKYPEVVADATDVALTTSDSAGVPIRGSCQLIPVAGSNYARGSVVVQGRKLNARAEIMAVANSREAVTTVKVVQKPPETRIPIEIKLRDEDFGNFRAKWADHEGKPHLLLVSARHKSLSRYLGPAPGYEGQNAPHFRLLLAEIVAESVCRKSLILESKERTWEFRWADQREDHMIAETVLAELQKRIREFVADAHAIMLSDAEAKRASDAV